MRAFIAVVPATAGTHTPCPRELARQMMTRKSGGYGSPLSRGRHRYKWRLSKQIELALLRKQPSALAQLLRKRHHKTIGGAARAQSSARQQGFSRIERRHRDAVGADERQACKRNLGQRGFERGA